MKLATNTLGFPPLRRIALAVGIFTLSVSALAQDRELDSEQILQDMDGAEQMETPAPAPREQLPLDDLRKFTI